MRAAIPVKDDYLDTVLSIRFGRSRFFVVADNRTSKLEFVVNPYCELKTGIGKGIKELLIAKYNVDTFIAYELGLKLQQLANDHDIQIILLHEKNKTLKELLSLLKLKI